MRTIEELGALVADACMNADDLHYSPKAPLAVVKAGIEELTMKYLSEVEFNYIDGKRKMSPWLIRSYLRTEENENTALYALYYQTLASITAKVFMAAAQLQFHVGE